MPFLYSYFRLSHFTYIFWRPHISTAHAYDGPHFRSALRAVLRPFCKQLYKQSFRAKAAPSTTHIFLAATPTHASKRAAFTSRKAPPYIPRRAHELHHRQPAPSRAATLTHLPSHKPPPLCASHSQAEPPTYRDAFTEARPASRSITSFHSRKHTFHKPLPPRASTSQAEGHTSTRPRSPRLRIPSHIPLPPGDALSARQPQHRHAGSSYARRLGTYPATLRQRVPPGRPIT